MRSPEHIHARILALACLVAALCVVARSQEPSGQKGRQTDETIRIETELVQTNVMVFDKRRQFELRVDGKPVDGAKSSATQQAIFIVE
jgi:hypothetical protein